jgi:elongation factor P
MIDVNELRKGVTFEQDGNIWKVLEYNHHKPGRGKATIRVKSLNLRNGTLLEMTFVSGDRVQDIRLDYHNVSFLYKDGDFFHFMDLETFDQPAIPADVIGNSANYLREGMEVKLTLYEGEALDIEIPASVELEVVEAGVSVKGDTATGVTKKVITDTGLEVQVPNFIESGDVIRVNTSDGSYITRV